MAPKHILTLADLPAPAVDLVALREHCRIDTLDESAVLHRLALAATLAVEKEAQRVLVQRQAVLRVNYLPVGRCPLTLPGGAVSAVTAMTIEGAAFTAFEVIGESPARMIPTTDWPTLTQDGYPVSVTYTVGPAIPPADLSVAVLMLAAEMFERRSEGNEGPVSRVPVSAASLIGRRRIMPR